MSTTGTTMTARRIELFRANERQQPAQSPSQRCAEQRGALVEIRDHHRQAAEHQQPQRLRQEAGLEQPEAWVQRRDERSEDADARREVPTTDEPAHRDDPEADGRREQLERFEAAPTEPREPSEDRHPSRGWFAVGSPTAPNADV